jgi:hypothetical protein
MTGYRDSNYEPYGATNTGRPMRPFNWVQWTGVALMVLSLCAYGYAFAGAEGWVPKLRVQPTIVGLTSLIIGINLINSRRREAIDIAPELAAERKRALIVVSLLCIFVFAAAITIAAVFDI